MYGDAVLKQTAKVLMMNRNLQYQKAGVDGIPDMDEISNCYVPFQPGVEDLQQDIYW